MNLLSNLSKEFQSYIKFFTSNRKLLWSERFYIWKSERRLSQAGGPIDMETLYQIIGHVNDEHLNVNPDHAEKHPVISDLIWRNVRKNPDAANDAYVFLVEEKIREHGLEKHITIKEQIYGVLIAETDIYYHTKYEIIIKDLVINAHDSRRKMYFYPLPLSDYGSEGAGIYLIFKNNYFFSSKSHSGFVDFFLKSKAYLVFENNNFKFTHLFLNAENSTKIELTGNIVEEGDMVITSKSDNSDDHLLNVVCLEDNILYSNTRSSRLEFKGDKCYFRGKNTVDFLELSIKEHLHWGGYQNIDPQGKHAHTHKEMFRDLKKKAAQNNDKMQETILHRELFKCEKAIIDRESKKNSWQDRVILFWSSSVSDYGTSWVRPLLLLAIINFLFAATVVAFFLEPKYSWWFMSTEFKPEFSWYLFLADWSVLFFQFFNPLSNLSDVTGVKNNGWISFIHILQKGFLAALLYEVIKIFRRFSK